MPKIIIDTDGDPKNTKLTIDGKKISSLAGISLYADLKCWCDSTPCWCTSVDFSYSTEKKDDKKSMKVRTRYSLDKANASFIQEEVIDTSNPSSEDYMSM
jgi:hypothetical protein